jgi:hypothetical protein
MALQESAAQKLPRDDTAHAPEDAAAIQPVDVR